MLLFFGYLVSSLVASFVLHQFPWLRQNIVDYTQAGAINAYVGGVLSYRWLRAWVRNLLLAAAIYLVCLTLALMLGNDWLIMFVALAGVVLLFPAAVALNLARLPAAYAGARLHQFGQTIWNGLPLNRFWVAILFPITGPLKLTAGCVALTGHALGVGQRWAWYLARILAGCNLGLLLLSALAIFDRQFNLQLLGDPVVIGLAALIAITIATLTIFTVDWVQRGIAGRAAAGAPFSIWAMSLVTVGLFLTVIWARMDPGFAGGVERGARAMNTWRIKSAHIWGGAKEQTRDIYVRAKVRIPNQYNRVTLPDGSLDWSLEAKSAVPAGCIGVMRVPDEPSETRDTRRAMKEVYWATKEDPDLVLVNSRLRKKEGRTYWVPDEEETVVKYLTRPPAPFPPCEIGAEPPPPPAPPAAAAVTLAPPAPSPLAPPVSRPTPGRPVLTVNNNLPDVVYLHCQTTSGADVNWGEIQPTQYRWLDFISPVPCDVRDGTGTVLSVVDQTGSRINVIPPLTENAAVYVNP